jgi:hypothetical protein
MGVKNYKEQYDRMIRFLKLLEEVYSGVEHEAGQDHDSEYYKDRVYSFFQNCYHLKDWMKNDSDVTLIVSKSDIENFVKSEYELKICGDVCNGSKHSRITTYKIDPNTGLKNTVWNMALGGGKPILSANFNIECKDQIYDALELARKCVGNWDEFIIKHNLPK